MVIDTPEEQVRAPVHQPLSLRPETVLGERVQIADVGARHEAGVGAEPFAENRGLHRYPDAVVSNDELCLVREDARDFVGSSPE